MENVLTHSPLQSCPRVGAVLSLTHSNLFCTEEKGDELHIFCSGGLLCTLSPIRNSVVGIK